LFALSRPFDAPLVLSYSPFDADTRARPRVMSVQRIQRIAEAFYAKVSVERSGPMSHSKLNRKDLNAGRPREAELFILCEP